MNDFDENAKQLVGFGTIQTIQTIQDNPHEIRRITQLGDAAAAPSR